MIGGSAGEHRSADPHPGLCLGKLPDRRALRLKGSIIKSGGLGKAWGGSLVEEQLVQK